MSRSDPAKHLRAMDIKRLCEPTIWEGYFKFSIVRNPWARLVSWYSAVSAQRAAFDAGKRFNRFRDEVLSRARTFEEFLEVMDFEVIDDDGPKWIFRNQLDYLTDETGAMLVDYVGRTETLERDFEYIRSRLYGDARPLTNVNPSAHGPYADYYTPAMAAKVAERYARDIEYFGYRFAD